MLTNQEQEQLKKLLQLMNDQQQTNQPDHDTRKLKQDKKERFLQENTNSTILEEYHSRSIKLVPINDHTFEVREELPASDFLLYSGFIVTMGIMLFGIVL